LQARLTKTDALVASIGGQLTEVEAKMLTLKKLYDLANQELNRYLNAEKRRLVQMVENLWDKYAVSNSALACDRSKTLTMLDRLLTGLGYLS
jgi:type I restriction enzyme M protein